MFLPLTSFLLGGKSNPPKSFAVLLWDFCSTAEVGGAMVVQLGEEWELQVILFALTLQRI